jgi:hypothetical protein
MRSIQFTGFMTVAMAFAVAGCAKQDEPIVNVEPTPSEVEAQKEWQARVDEQERQFQKLGGRNQSLPSNFIQVRSQEMEHRQLTKKWGSQSANGDFLKVRNQEMEHRRQIAAEEKAKKNATSPVE